MRYPESAKLIQEGMDIKGFNQLKLAKALDVTPSLVSHWVRGRKRPGLNMAQRLGIILGIDVNRL